MANYVILHNNIFLILYGLIRCNLCDRGKQFHVSPCQCFPPQLSQYPERHMTGSGCYYASPAAQHTFCPHASTRRAAFCRPRLSRQQTSPLLLALSASLCLCDTHTDCRSCISNGATASCGEPCAILSHVSHCAQDAAFFFFANLHVSVD